MLRLRGGIGLAVAASLALALPFACGKKSDGPGQTGGAGSTGSTGSAGSGPGTGGQGGTSVTCSNSDRNTLPIDSTGWVARECNNRNIQGAWYCFDDGINNTSCVDGQTPYRASSNAMCLSGTTTVDSTFAAYGAALALSLNQATSGGKSGYSATSNGVTGFRVTITGNLGGNPLRVGFTNSANPGTSPFVEFTAAGTYSVTIASAMVPASWGVPEAGQYANPASIFDLQFMLAGGSRASTYDFCVTSVTPIVGSTTGTAGTTGTPGTAGTTGAAGRGGAGGSGGSVACSNTDLNNLPIDAAGRVARECNNRNIQGNWYCFDDNINNTSCVDGQTPYRSSAAGMCLSGTTTVDATFAAWGGSLGLSLNQSTSGTESAYNATANGVTGFRIQVSGNLGGNPLRIAFSGSANPGTSPFVEVTTTGSIDIPIASAMVPAGWSVPEAGQYANPTNIWDIMFQIPGGSRASTYDFCITRVTPIASGATGTAGTSGAAGRGGTTGSAGRGGTTGAGGTGGGSVQNGITWVDYVCYPACASAASDPDRDGWGEEQIMGRYRSCIVRGGTSDTGIGCDFTVPPPFCRMLDGTCQQDDDCCSGLKCYRYQCVGCSGQGETCSAFSDCCATYQCGSLGSYCGGSCKKSPTDTCNVNDDCCGGWGGNLCVNGRCSFTCADLYQTCDAFGGGCCSRSDKLTYCHPTSNKCIICKTEGDYCESDVECCARLPGQVTPYLRCGGAPGTLKGRCVRL